MSDPAGGGGISSLEHGPTPAAWNATVVQKSAEQTSPAQPVNEYAIRLPAALEKKYPGAEYIAEGGVSRVFHVRDEKNNRDAAVKVPIRFDEVTGTQFTKELTIWEGLHHKNIVELVRGKYLPPAVYRDGVCPPVPCGDAVPS